MEAGMENHGKINRNLLIVDDEPNVISSLKRELRNEGYIIYAANSGIQGLNLLKNHDIGVILSDQMMPEMDGVTFLEFARRYNPDVVRIILTGYSSFENTMAAVNRSQIFGCLTKPWEKSVLKDSISKAFEYYNLTVENKRLQKLIVEQNKQLKLVNKNLEGLIQERTSQLEEVVREGVIMLALAAEAKDDDTGDHVYRIRDMTMEICLGLGLSYKESEQIGFFSLMHDVGKIQVPDNILKKQGPLTDEERAVMMTHCIAGEKILGNKPFYKTAREIARSHHERWDGSGYPEGLKGEEIPIAARIVAVSDVFDALTHERPYKPAWPLKKAITEMKNMSGTYFDPKIFNVFLNIVSRTSYKVVNVYMPGIAVNSYPS